MSNLFMSFEKLIAGFAHAHRTSKTLLVGIDGCGASGKSTFAATLQALNPKITVVHMDDFYLPSAQRQPGSITNQQVGSDFDWTRLSRQVLEPLRNDNLGQYQRYDWNTDSLSEWHNVPVGDTVIVEGNYTTRKELATFYDVRIWVECPRDLRLRRGLERDGEKARPVWENYWMPVEDLYVKTHKPFEYADLIIDGSYTPSSVNADFICLSVKKDLKEY